MPAVGEKETPPARIRGEAVFQLMYNAAPNDNLLLSPLSAVVMLAVLLMGTRADSAMFLRSFAGLEDEDAEMLLLRLAADLKSLRDGLPNSELDLSNSFWYQRDHLQLRPHLANLFRDALRVDVREADFRPGQGAQSQFNAWLQKGTRGKITESKFPARPPWAVADVPYPLFLGGNAIFLSAHWKEEFEEYRFKTDVFHGADGSVRQHSFMERNHLLRAGEQGYFSSDSFEALQLPFADGRLVMEVFLPRNSDGLPAMIRDHNPVDPDRWHDEFRSMPNMYILLPTFEMVQCSSFFKGNSGRILGPIQRPGHDFLPMFAGEEKRLLGISDIVQAASLRVDRKGIEAGKGAVISEAKTGKMASSPEVAPVFFAADRPFFYRIRDLVTRRNLFAGTFCQPHAQGESLSEEERQDRILYRRQLKLGVWLKAMSEEELRDWMVEIYFSLLRELDLDATPWAEIPEKLKDSEVRRRWRPLLIGLYGQVGNRRQASKRDAESARDALVEAGIRRPEAVKLVREAMCFSLLFLLATVLYRGDLTKLEDWLPQYVREEHLTAGRFYLLVASRLWFDLC